MPAVSGALGSALAVLEAARDPRVREVVRSASRKPLAVPAKKSGPGKYILIGLGVVAVAGIAYAAWQTLRVDEDLWVEDLSDSDPQDRRTTTSSRRSAARCSAARCFALGRSPTCWRRTTNDLADPLDQLIDGR